MSEIHTIDQLRETLGPNRPQFLELWFPKPGGQTLCALINGQNGWLMYLRKSGDAGFSSRNPHYCGEKDATVEYELSNGQHDLYPASWALPLAELQRATEYFIIHAKAPDWLAWHNDSGDGVLIGKGQ